MMVAGPHPAVPPWLRDDPALRYELARESLRQAIAAQAAWLGSRGEARTRTRAAALDQLQACLRQLRRLPDARHFPAPGTVDRGAPADPGPMPDRSGLDRDAHRLPADESARIFVRHIQPGLLDGCAASRAPRAIVFGAHLGCPTGAAMARASSDLGGSRAAVTLMLDDLRAFHPQYAALSRHSRKLADFYTEADAVRWMNMAVQSAADRHLPLVLEAAMRGAEPVTALFSRLRGCGYAVEARALAVPHAQSWLAILCLQELSRIELGTAKTHTRAAHQATFDGLAAMLERIERERMADLVTVHDARDEGCYERRTTDDGAAPRAAEVLAVHRLLPPTLEQLRRVHASCVWLEAVLAHAQRGAGNDERLQMEGLRWEAEYALLSAAFLALPQQDCLREFPELSHAFRMLGHVREAATAVADADERQRFVKRGFEGIARRVANGNLIVPAPWLPIPAGQARTM